MMRVAMEPMEEVPLKELRQNQGRPEAYRMTQIAYSESRGGGEVTNVACKQSTKD